MKIDKIIIVPKLSKYELDMHIHNLSHQEVIDKYTNEGIDVERILKSHERQKQSLEKLKKLFPEEHFILRDNLTKEMAKTADLIISLGGDNHFTYLSHYIEDNLILGINSDPIGSDGALTNFTIDSFEKLVDKIKQGDFEVEEWTRLEAIVNNRKTNLVTSEVFIGENERKNMSRHILKLGNKKEEQRGSGFLISTGAGSTGWYDSALRYLHKNGKTFKKTEKIARFLLTEPFRGKKSGFSMLHGVLKPEQELELHSLNDTNGKLILDSHKEYDFNMGAKVIIRISDKPLRVVKI